jgi:ligand-binding SRPBCC domain-containing protein
MKRLYRQQWLPITLDEAWDFFSSPKNLNEITPEDMVFEIKSDVPEKMYQGMFIVYAIRPVLNIPMKWVTEITHVVDKKFFVDEQRVGPYHIWHHEHHFEEKDGGVLMTDILHYHVGKSFLGLFASKLFVDKKVENIFDYRYKILEAYFSKK